ncbi:MAG: hypothetical protein ABMB14_23320 [Myxococcota bacterium]
MRRLAILVPALTGCLPDDWNGEAYTGPPDSGAATTETGAPTGSTGTGDGTIVGDWVSAGDDRSPLFAADPFAYQRVDATFEADGSYVVTTVTPDGAAIDLVGSYTVDDGTTPATIALSQQTPYVAEAEGIYAVDGGTMTYEVVQTVPDYGFTPPTPATGFGSTGGPGFDAGANVQIYRWVP